jgi:drug/metabolite transporter (DMT)-like permease
VSGRSLITRHAQTPAYVALACVCFFWGTTYLGIRIALESFSPAMLMCLRYLASGGVLFIGAILSGARMPGSHELWRTALFGILTIGCGTGSLAYAEQWMPSGFAALVVCTQPFWMVAVESLMPGGEPLHWSVMRGMLVGLAGVIILIAPEAGGQGTAGTALIGGALLLQAGAVLWSLGSVSQKRMGGETHPFVNGAIHQLATGLVFAIPAFAGSHKQVWDAKGLAAIAYLAVFGGVVGYSSFLYSMHHLPVALVSIYTYINPIVAVVLGYVFYREPLGWREVAAMGVIFAGVALVKQASQRGVEQANAQAAMPVE